MMETREYYNIFENEYSHFYYVSLHEKLIKCLKIYAPKIRLKILDVGCGTGSLALQMGFMGEVYGIDNNPVAIQLAQKRGFKRCQVGSALKIPFMDGSFDVVIAADLLSQLTFEESAILLREVKRVLKPGGIFLLRTAAYHWLRGSHDQHIRILSRYSKQKLYNLLTEGGFKILKLSHVNFFVLIPVFLKRLFQKIAKSPAKSDIHSLPSWLNQGLIYLEKIETRCLFCFDLPMGVGLLTVAQLPTDTK